MLYYSDEDKILRHRCYIKNLTNEMETAKGILLSRTLTKIYNNLHKSIPLKTCRWGLNVIHSRIFEKNSVSDQSSISSSNFVISDIIAMLVQRLHSVQQVSGLSALRGMTTYHNSTWMVLLHLPCSFTVLCSFYSAKNPKGY